MISAIVDGVLLVALIATTLRMVQMHRELRRLGSYHDDYQRIFDQTALALDGIEVSIQEINVKGAQILNALGSRMDDARELIAEIDGLTREAKRQQSVLKAELKELSKATAMMGNAGRFTPKREDLDIFDDADATVKTLKTAGVLSAAGKPTTTIHHGEPAQQTPTRVHRIDNTLGSPFRSVSMNQKDNI
ncbi:hypothetical protein E1180_11930 [Roseibium denhamense]|uniref:Uncharacterized protein n=1 Tax=Roseibium denhamense TaxID=76305 RepID=A0ABY1PEL2_9HYPH|nr:hypothetical protein [Roseibium denhamense]MTI06223.1 hypothetical protein [Roseibium denhamense]SMP32697.1 hypothetical protein SAMN06265374_3578 [Roseibium denhamense]